jgi:hypothetical protein
LPEPRQIEGNQQVLIKWDYLRFTFSFQLLPAFAAIHHNSHDTYMTPRFLRSRRSLWSRCPFGRPVRVSLARWHLRAGGHDSGAFFSPKIGALAFFFHAISG